jgi:MSHA biogenesis protein MshK
MDEVLMTPRCGRRFPARALLEACCVLAAAATVPAAAQALRDPTRPPAAMLPGGAGARAAGPVAAPGPRLQSVLIAPQPGGRHVAVIDGETVRLGEMYRGARVTRMTPDEVELVRGRERRVLKLNPTQAATAGTGIERVRSEREPNERGPTEGVSRD